MVRSDPDVAPRPRMAAITDPSRAAVDHAPTPKGRRRRQELVAAARSVFIERGYFETRIEDIAQRAKVSRATFYTYFDSKDDVLAVLVDELVDGLLEASSAPLQRQPSPYQSLVATIRQFMEAYRDRAPMIRILEQAVAYNQDFLAIRLGIRARFGEQIAGAIRHHQQHRPDGERLDADLAARALGGMVDDFARGCYLLEQLVDQEAAITTLATIWARAVGLPVAETGEGPGNPAAGCS